MKFTGPGSSLQPARESARIQSRASERAARKRHAGTHGAAGGWRLTTDQNGNLVAAHSNGSTALLAQVISTDNTEED